MKLFLTILLMLIFLAPVQSQELNCRVELNTSQIQGTDTQIFTTLKDAITEYMNDRKWSEAQVATNERIECSIVITVKEKSGERFKCELQVQSKRPVFNASYTSPLLNFKDNEFEFSYQEFQPLVYNETSMESNLTGVLNFYAYLILALDFDSFAPQGGTAFIQKANEFVTLGQSTMELGWKAFDNPRNRHAIVAALTDPVTTPFRTLWYEYHRKGLDEMNLSVDKGRAKISTLLKEFDELNKLAPTSVIFPMFSDTKIDELINVYGWAPNEEKDEVIKILSAIYPTQSSRLQEIKKEKR